MGLDNYWKKNAEEYGEIEGEFKVCGGILSGNGNDSFRGKVYHRLVEDITGEDLYQDVIENDTIKEMAESLESATYNPQYNEFYYIDEEEFRDLVKMFRLHADAGHYLESCW
jgi:hypothetical protein